MSETLGTRDRAVLRTVGVLAYHLVLQPRYRLGPDDDFWDTARSGGLPALHRLLTRLDSDGYGQYTLGAHEYAGTLAMVPEAAEAYLFEQGLVRQPLSALKFRADVGDVEVGSWMFRERMDADRQVHVMLFLTGTGEDAETDLYAHREYAAGHPNGELAVWHYTGREYDPAAGVAWVRDNLDVVQRERHG